ncbi:MAG: entericidin [Ponticaulis sp.]|nr:entericidin [Ponticaulis sp.]
MNNFWKIFAVGAIALGLSACNTVEGFGEDVEKVGSEIEESAESKQ